MMLVLSRKKSECVVVGGVGKIFIVEIRNDKVRFGLEFPSDVIIHREEVLDEIKNEMRKQMPSLLMAEQDAVIDFLIAEIEFEASERRRQEKSDAALAALSKVGDVTLEINREKWEVSATTSGCVAIRE